MRAVLADTGPLYALADPDDQFHTRSRGEADRLRREARLVAVSCSTLLETQALVLRRLGPAVAQAWLREARDGCGLLNPSAADYAAAADRLEQFADQAVTLFDAVLAEVAIQSGFPVWTYDHHFDMMAVAVWR